LTSSDSRWYPVARGFVQQGMPLECFRCNWKMA